MFCRENVIIPDASLFSVRSHSCNLFQCLSYFSKLVCIGKRSNDRQTDTPPNHLDHLWKFHLCKHTHSYKERERWEILKYKLFASLSTCYRFSFEKHQSQNILIIIVLNYKKILLLVWLLVVWSWMKEDPSHQHVYSIHCFSFQFLAYLVTWSGLKRKEKRRHAFRAAKILRWTQ